MSEDELTTSQIARELSVTSATARLWCRRGLFPNARAMDTARGVIWMVPRGDLKGFEPPKPTGRPPKPKASGPNGKVKVKPGKKGGKK